MFSRSVKLTMNEREPCQPSLAVDSTFLALRELLVSGSRLAVITELK